MIYEYVQIYFHAMYMVYYNVVNIQLTLVFLGFRDVVEPSSSLSGNTPAIITFMTHMSNISGGMLINVK